MTSSCPSRSGRWRRASGSAPLDDLTWWDLLTELDDDEAAGAVFGALRAQGRTLADTPAVGGLLAQPFLEAVGRDTGGVRRGDPASLTQR